jgi:Ca2+:H+ antiporter
MRQLSPFLGHSATAPSPSLGVAENASPYAHDDWASSSQQTLTMSLDSVKSAARRAAWKADSKWDYANPFSRTTSRDSSISRSTSRNNPDYDVEAVGSDGAAQNGGNVPLDDSGTQSPSGSPTSCTDVESHHGAAASYYYGDGNTSQAETLSGDVDSISRTTSHKKTNGLPHVPENEAVTGEQEKELPYDEERNEEERKRKYDEMMKRKIPVWQQTRTVLFPRWVTINWLLVAAPAGIGLHFSGVDPLIIFIVNFIAIVPLAGLLSFATEELALRIGEVLGGLLNASFG